MRNRAAAFLQHISAFFLRTSILTALGNIEKQTLVFKGEQELFYFFLSRASSYLAHAPFSKRVWRQDNYGKEYPYTRSISSEPSEPNLTTLKPIVSVDWEMKDLAMEWLRKRVVSLCCNL